MDSTHNSADKSEEEIGGFISRSSVYWKEGKMLLHKNGIIFTDENLYTVYLNHRSEGRKVISTSLEGAYKYLMDNNNEVKEGLK